MCHLGFIFSNEGEEVCVKQITVADFNAKLEEIFNSATPQSEYDTVRENIKKVLLKELITQIFSIPQCHFRNSTCTLYIHYLVVLSISNISLTST